MECNERKKQTGEKSLLSLQYHYRKWRLVEAKKFFPQFSQFYNRSNDRVLP